ncbi:MAG: anthranilate synthase component II [Vulcanimicrobiaceae bacterium]
MSKLLFIDNFDSFTYNVVHLLASQGASLDVVLNDDPRLEPRRLDEYDALVVGPGPGNPAQAPRMLAMLRAAAERHKPVLGVCLGLQAVGEVFGGTVTHAPHLMHGKTSAIHHDQTGIFEGVPTPFTATRYHSLCIAPSSLPQELVQTAHSDDGVIQGIAHRSLPIFAVQFHPESVLSEHGERIAANFLALARAT